MTAKQVLNAKPGQKVGLGNGLRLICDPRNGARYFELRKRVRGKDYSWGVGNVETLTIAGCNKALSATRPQAGIQGLHPEVSVALLLLGQCGDRRTTLRRSLPGDERCIYQIAERRQI